MVLHFRLFLRHKNYGQVAGRFHGDFSRIGYFKMKNKKQFWVTVAILNLGIVALMGVTLRSKILFPLQGIDFTNILRAHSNFAFTGWITLMLFTLLIYDVLPAHLNNKKIYNSLLWGIFLAATGMLISFLCQGYAFYSILFSTLFILVSYPLVYLLGRDILRSETAKPVKILGVCALICLVLSSVGPFVLAYLKMAGSDNFLLYRDATYTYLHMQYNGFFTLSVFALLFNNLNKRFDQNQLEKARKFASILSISIAPTLFISYLWHYPDIWVRSIAIVGCLFIVIVIVYLINFLHSLKKKLHDIPPFIRIVGSLSFIAFALKSFLQTGTVIPSLGKLVFGDRAIIIGYLHLVLLGFITLYIIAHLLYNGMLNISDKFTRTAIRTFAGAIIFNELILMIQGFGNMLMLSNRIYAWLLWFTSIWLFSGAIMIIIARLHHHKQHRRDLV